MKLRKILRTLTLCACMLALAQRALGQQAPHPPAPRMPKSLRMQSTLFEAEIDARSLAVAEARGLLGRRGIRMRKDGKVHVEIVGSPGGTGLAASALAPFGGEVEGSWRHRVDAWIPLQRLSQVARALPSGYFLQRAKRPEPDETVGEGPAVINSDNYTPAGQGLRIAVIDVGYAGLTAAANNGDAPGAAIRYNYTGNTFEDPADGTHGTGCVESAFDHCPAAMWYIYKIDSLTDLGSAVNSAINLNVDIISHSLSWFNEGWDDDSGGACAAANNAASSGILFFTSAGNRAQQHWQGSFNTTDGEDWHEFGAGGDETINMVVPSNGSATCSMSWDTTGGTFDYDLYLYDATLTLLTSSTNGGNSYESFTWTNMSTTAQTVHLCVWRSSGGITDFEIFVTPNAVTLQQHIVSEGSTTSPSNSSGSGVISVGAVAHGDFGSAGGTVGIIKDYSGRGPSNSGMTLPDITGPTDTNNFTYGRFGGTSCATPNAAGAACAFLSAHSQYVAAATEYLLERQAQVFRDWGDAGMDNTYGYGGIHLVDYAPDTLWISRDYGGPDLHYLPFYTVWAAHTAAVPGGRLLFIPGGHYPEPVTLTKNLTLETVGPAATLGQ